MPLYAGNVGFMEHFLICFRATLGDVVIILVMYFIVSFVKKDWYWLKNMEARVAMLIVILGILIAIIIEQRALQYGSWAYANQMPILPFFGVGLSPILQMMILPIITYWISGLFYRKLIK